MIEESELSKEQTLGNYIILCHNFLTRRMFIIVFNVIVNIKYLKTYYCCSHCCIYYYYYANRAIQTYDSPR